MWGRSCVGFWIAVLAACGGPQTSQSGPTVSVLRQTGASCFELMASPAPAAGLGPMVCPGTGKNTQLLAGIDLVELVIDYGAIDFPEAASVPAPTVVVLTDGKPTTTSASIVPQQRVNGHTLYLAAFTAPEAISNDVQISVSVASGYATDVATIYQTVQPGAMLSVLAKTPSGCFTLAGGVAPAPELGLSNLCDPMGTADVHAGVDALELVVDYRAGSNVVPDIPPTIAIPTPSVAMTVDGAAQPAIEVGAEQRAAANRRYFTAQLHAPDTPSHDVLFQVKTVSGAIPVQARIETDAVRPEVSIAECGSSCTAIAAVGAVHLRVALPGDVPQPVAIHGLLGHALTADPVSAVTTAFVDGHTEATVAVPVPTGVPDGTIWTLQAQVGTAIAGIDVTLHRPAITASASCASPCVVTTGAPLGLKVVAPFDIHDRQAIYTTALDGLPQVAQGTLDLLTIDNDGETIMGAVTLTAPAQPGTWVIDASVSGYHAQTIMINVVSP